MEYHLNQVDRNATILCYFCLMFDHLINILLICGISFIRLYVGVYVVPRGSNTQLDWQRSIPCLPLKPGPIVDESVATFNHTSPHMIKLFVLFMIQYRQYNFSSITKTKNVNKHANLFTDYFEWTKNPPHYSPHIGPMTLRRGVIVI